jgi:hypothetical protein
MTDGGSVWLVRMDTVIAFNSLQDPYPLKVIRGVSNVYRIAKLTRSARGGFAAVVNIAKYQLLTVSRGRFFFLRFYC